MNDKKMKIKELAAEWKLDSKEILDAVRAEGFVQVRNERSVIEQDAINRLRKRFNIPEVAETAAKEVIVRRRRNDGQGKADNKDNAADNKDARENREGREGRNRDRDGRRENQNRDNREGKDNQNREGRDRQKQRQKQQQQQRSEAGPAKVICRPNDNKPAEGQTAKVISPAAKRDDERKQPQVNKQADSANAERKADNKPDVKIIAPASKGNQQQAGNGSGTVPPKVRIISRPNQGAGQGGGKGEGRGEGRGGHFRDNQNRDGRDRDDREMRGAGRDHDGRDRDDRDRDRDSDSRQHRGQGNRSRSGGNRGGSGPRPSVDAMPFDAPQPMDSRSGQSKKKRNKGRRTVDFQQNDGFGHHQEEHENTQRVRSKGRRKNAKQVAAPITQPLKAAKRKLRIENTIRVSDMAHQMGLKANEIIKVLFNLGFMATINQSIDFDTAAVVAAEFNYEVEKTGFEEKDYLEPSAPDNPEDLKPRPPVVTIMGHVDHGKTSLLDAIRKTHVTSDEAGGITQHIGAYHVNTKNGDVVFLDTPGHEAFTAMRARGAKVTDLVILVVAADDGVMEQTREAINHAKAAEVPIIVAVNKMDKPGANPDRVMRELAELGLQPEDWGGDTIVAKVSAKTHQGLDELLELVALQSEVMELKANPNKLARGHIIEAKLDKGRGPVATVLIQEGTLHQGDNFVCGTFSGRVRALLNDQGKKVRDAGPSIPVEVQGFTGVPVAGEEFAAVSDERVARRIADARATKQREKELASESKVTLETFLSSTAGEEQKTLNLVVKADVQGTLEAVQESLRKASTDKVAVNIVHGGTGAITESDIMLASASKAIIIGFNVRPTAKIKDVAAHENVDIRFYDIIYKLVDDVKSAMAGLLSPVEKEVYLGQAEVRQSFTLPKVGTIAGSYVADGKITRNARIRLLRDGVVVWTGKVSSLKRFKDDVREVARGNECGIGLENFNDIKVGDIVEAFETVQEAATL